MFFVVYPYLFIASSPWGRTGIHVLLIALFLYSFVEYNSVKRKKETVAALFVVRAASLLTPSYRLFPKTPPSSYSSCMRMLFGGNLRLL
jgi:hypothetical protein